MKTVVVLDAGPLGLATNPRASSENDRCSRWLESLLERGMEIAVPEIADYEVRRELLRAGKEEGLARLDDFVEATTYLPLHTAAMRKAAEYWARVRSENRPTADDKALDADVILAAQVSTYGAHETELILATTNVGHLDRFPIAAKMWSDI